MTKEATSQPVHRQPAMVPGALLVGLICSVLSGGIPASAESLREENQTVGLGQQPDNSGSPQQPTASDVLAQQDQPGRVQETAPRLPVEASDSSGLAGQAGEAQIQSQPQDLAVIQQPEPLAEPLLREPTEPVPVSNAADAASEEAPYNIPIVRDQKVEGHMRFFHTTIRSRFEQWLARLGYYKPLVERIFSQFDLPSDLVYLSLVESGFNPHARSRARATGPWQFMKGTAKRYGLRVDKYVDERKDPNKSTVAAAYYLRDLYDQFGTWPLAMAAYNAGEGKVQRALDKANAESFWEIAKTKHLRRETKEYVPRIMAATIIAKNPDQFGFSQGYAEAHQFEEVIVSRPLLLRDIAKVTGVPFAELRRLNPELLKDVTPPDDRNYHLKVPVGARETVEQKLDQVPTWKPSVQLVRKDQGREEPGAQSTATGWYRVRGGDKLSTIAKRFRISVRELKSKNNLTSSRIRPGDLLLVSR